MTELLTLRLERYKESLVKGESETTRGKAQEAQDLIRKIVRAE